MCHPCQHVSCAMRSSQQSPRAGMCPSPPSRSLVRSQSIGKHILVTNIAPAEPCPALFPHPFVRVHSMSFSSFRCERLDGNARALACIKRNCDFMFHVSRPRHTTALIPGTSVRIARVLHVCHGNSSHARTTTKQTRGNANGYARRRAYIRRTPTAFGARRGFECRVNA